MKRLLPWLPVMCAVCIILSACSNNLFDESDKSAKSDSELIEARIECFTEAYNDGDLKAAVNCLDSKTRSAYLIAIGVTEKITQKYSGYDIDIFDFYGFAVEAASDEALLKVEIQNIDIVDEKNATVDVTLGYKDIKSELADEGVFIMVKEDNDWFIKDIHDN